MSTIAQLLSLKRQPAGMPSLDAIRHLPDRDSRMSLLTEIGAFADKPERELLNRIMVWLKTANASVVSMCSLSWSNYGRMQSMNNVSCLAFPAWSYVFGKLNPGFFLAMKHLNPLSVRGWYDKEQDWLDAHNMLWDAILIISMANLDLDSLGKVDAATLRSYTISQYMDAMHDRPERMQEIASLLGVDLPEIPADEIAPPSLIGESRNLKRIVKNMGEWTEKEFWDELTELYNTSLGDKDTKTLKEILFLKAKSLGLMKDAPPPSQVNLIQVFDQQATDAIKAMFGRQPKEIEG